MVTFKNRGRLGNFLFQAATAYAYALDVDERFSVPFSPDEPANPIYLSHLQDLALFLRRYTVTYCEDENPKGSPIPGFLPSVGEGYNIILDGYWQDYRRFAHRRAEIIEAFRLGPPLQSPYVGVHVRRGDFVTETEVSGRYNVPTVEWWDEQMKKFPGRTFMFFSDDIEWCLENLGNPGDKFRKDFDPLDDLIALSQCAHQICSPSTFSWWGAWLNQNPGKRVIVPKVWMPGVLDADGICPPEWERA